MEIGFNFTTCCQYGGRLNPPLTYFDKYISKLFVQNEVKSYVKSIDITFMYPPLVLFEGFSEMKKDFNDRYIKYDKKSYVRFGKKRSKINLITTFPELSEYFQKEYVNKIHSDGAKYIKQDVPDKYLNKTNKDILRLLCDKMLEIIGILELKIQKDEIFESEKARKIIIEIKKYSTLKFFRQIELKCIEEERNDRIQSIKLDRKQRSLQTNKKDKLIFDIRLFASFERISPKIFMPYNLFFCGEILELLRKLKFKCPGYTHLYISVSDTFENALYEAIRANKGYVYGLAILTNPKEYKRKHEKAKKRIVIKLIKEGLFDIAKIDNLDFDKLNKAFDLIENRHCL